MGLGKYKLPNPHLLYLHGFLSSPKSQKAQQTVSYCDSIGMARAYTVPLLKNGPKQNISRLCAWVEANLEKNLVLIGSSLGGYYAAYLAEKYDLPAVLINPAVRPFDLLESYIGSHKNYHTDDVHQVTNEHMDELRALFVAEPLHVDKLMILLQTGDETLDYRLALEKYNGSLCIVRIGGDHSYANYACDLPQIFDFLLSRIA
ncbi:MAG: putative esterase YcpF (UPF0227 family) [Pseudohongiellaceae bacterium]|jgi:predicted esterase YcpF (UPF0227 family)